jgi:hypothetical protein
VGLAGAYTAGVATVEYQEAGKEETAAGNPEKPDAAV